MSLYIFDIYPDHATVSADTRKCYQAPDGKFYRLHDNAPKLHVVDDMIITIGGVAWIGTYILDKFQSDTFHTVKRLHEITLETVPNLDGIARALGILDQNYKNNPFALELCILRYDPLCKHNVFYNIVTSQEYRLERFDVDGVFHPSARCYGGIDMEHARAYFKAHPKETRENYLKALIRAYEVSTSEKIGGKLLVAQQNKASVSVSEYPLKDQRRIQDFSELVGYNIAGQNLIIECPDPNGGVQQFKVDSSGVVINGGRFYIKNSKGAFGVDGNYGLMLGTTELFEATDTGYVLPTCIDDNGKLILDDEGFPKDTNVWFGIDGKVFVRGHIVMESGSANGDFYANNFYFNDGDSVRTLLDQTTSSFDLSSLKKIDLGEVVIDGETGNIDMTGNLNLSGLSKIVFGGNTFVESRYSTDKDAEIPAGWTDWDDSWTGASDIEVWAIHSYDGGETWVGPSLFQGKTGAQGSDANVPAWVDAYTASAQFSTLIDDEWVIAMNLYGSKIFGGQYFNDEGTHRLEMSHGDAKYGAFRLYNDSYGDVPYFSIFDTEIGETHLMVAGEELIRTKTTAREVYAKPQGTWDFSDATVEGFVPTWG